MDYELDTVVYHNNDQSLEFSRYQKIYVLYAYRHVLPEVFLVILFLFAALISCHYLILVVIINPACYSFLSSKIAWDNRATSGR